MNENISLEILETLMKKHGAVIRAIPEEVTHIFEKRHADHYDGEIRYLDEFKREMLIVKETPKHAGEFLVLPCCETSNIVDFKNAQYFKSITDAAEYLMDINRLEKMEARLEKRKGE